MINYQHEPFKDFSLEQNRQAYTDALALVESYLGQDYPLIIGGERITTDDKIESYNPANHSQLIGRVSKATKEHAEQAMQIADATFKQWKKVKPESRADVLFKAAAIIRRRHFEFSALLTKEAGKTWVEADVETAECIDFLEYYGRQMLEMKDGRPVASRKDEFNRYDYIPLGVGVVISPWNFPFAIMGGTTAAALVTGNTVLLKPASTTPVIAYKFVEVLEEAGLPAGVVNFIPGGGGEIGDYLVDHHRTRFIS